jgi:hypothetical protein
VAKSATKAEGQPIEVDREGEARCAVDRESEVGEPRRCAVKTKAKSSAKSTVEAKSTAKAKHVAPSTAKSKSVNHEGAL